MANDGKIYIIVTDQLPGGTGPIQPDKPQQDKEKKDPLGDFAKHQFFNLIERQAKQAVNYSISNIGNFTGDYVKQAATAEAMNVLNFATNLGMAALAGSKYGPYGALIAVGVTLIGKGITTGEQIYAGYVENVRQNRTIEQLRTRAGLNSTNNGSRGTDY